MKLIVSLPSAVSCFVVQKWRALWHKKHDVLLAANEHVIFALDFERASCTKLAEIKNSQPHQRAHWQRYLPHLGDTEASQIVINHQFTTLMRDKDNNYWLHRDTGRFVLDPFSLQRRFSEPVLAVAFLQAGSVILLLFAGRIVLDRCISWWSSEPAAQMISHNVSADLTHVLTDNLRSFIVYGERNLVVYNAALQIVWQETYAKTIQLAWLSSSGFFIFLLFADNSIHVVDKCDGKVVASAEPLVLLETKEIVPKNSVDGTVTSFYIVTQNKGDDLQQTLIYCLTLCRDDTDEAISPVLRRQLIVKRPHVEEAVKEDARELTLADLR